LPQGDDCCFVFHEIEGHNDKLSDSREKE
jgi:hypothetical protein